MIDDNASETGDIAFPMPTETRTPITDSQNVLNALFDIYCTVFGDHLGQIDGDRAKSFSDNVIGPLWNSSGTTGDAAVAEYFKNIENSTETTAIETVRSLINIPCAYCIQAYEHAEDNTPLAWTFVADAWHWIGILQGWLVQLQVGSSSLSDNSRKAALASHAENHAIAKDLEAWHMGNRLKFTTFDAAATAAIKVVPFSFRTARKHIVEFSKTYPLHAKGKPRM